MRVAVIGSRNVKISEKLILRVLDALPEGCSEIVSGGADGVDEAARKAAARAGLCCTCFAPDYEKYGRAAPLRRNEQIVAYSDRVLAFWDYCSKGTQNALLTAVRSGKPIRIFELDADSLL